MIFLVLFLLALIPFLTALYLLLLTLLSAKLPQPTPVTSSCHFDILVPAHNEATVIRATIESLKALSWPKENYRIIVIADHCTDDTASIAKQAGVLLLERTHGSARGKGHALALGADYSAKSRFADALVVVDADSLVTPNLLEAFASRIEQGAQALQANYGVSNPNDSWRTRLMTIAYAAFHGLRGRARERLGASAGLRGNGMCFTKGLLASHPFQTFSLTEDIEQGVLLGLQGIRVWHVDEAFINAESASSSQAAASQRARWEFGRWQLARQYIGPLLKQSLKARCSICLDLALDLILPPLSHIVALNGGLLFACILLEIWLDLALWPWLILSSVIMLIHIIYIFRGWQLSSLPPRALSALLLAPFFILWKLAILIKHKGEAQWIKTQRNKNTKAG